MGFRSQPIGFSSVTNDATAQAWFNACATAGSAVSGADQTAWNNFIAGLRTDGLLSTFDFIAPLGAATSTQALIDMIGLRNMTTSGSPAFVAHQGYTGGSPAFIDTTFNPSSGSPQWSLNSAHLAIFTRTNVATSSSMGVGTGGNSYIDPTDGGTAFFSCNGVPFTNTAGSGIGFWEATTTSSSRVDAYKNGVSFAFNNGGSNAMPTGTNMFILKDTTNDFSTAQHSLASGGSGHSSAQALAYYNRVHTLATALGW